MLLCIGLFLFTFPFSLVIAVLYPLFILAFRFVVYEIFTQYSYHETHLCIDSMHDYVEFAFSNRCSKFFPQDV